MSRIIDRCRLEILEAAADDSWRPITALSDAEWTGFAPAGCGVDQGRVIALPDSTEDAALDPNAPDREFRLVDEAGDPLFQFLGYLDDRRPRAKGKIILGISTTPTLHGRWVEIEPAEAAAS